MSKSYFVNFKTDLKTETYSYKYRKDAIEKYNELVEHCYFPNDYVSLVFVETMSTYPDNEEV